MSVTVPLWAAAAALVVVVLVAAGLGAARSRQARRLLGPWVYDRSEHDREAVRAAQLVRGDSRAQLNTLARVRVLPPGRDGRAGGERQ